MKKFLSFVLTLALILGCVCTASAATYSDMAICSRPEAVSVLSDLDIVSGVGNNRVAPKNSITRAEVTTLIVRILGYDEYAKDRRDTGFTDVPKTHWASGYIEFARQFNLVEGVGNKKFNPDAKMSYQEVLTVLVRALGHKLDSSYGGWPYNYIIEAKYLGITGDVPFGADYATREDVMQLIYNAMEIPMGTTDKNGVFTEYSTKRTFLSLAGASSKYYIVDFDGARALNDMTLLGHYVKEYVDEDGKVLSLVDKSTELTGKISDGAFYVGTTKYTFASNALTPSAVSYTNNAYVGTVGAVSALATETSLNVELEGTVITKVYSAKNWAKTTTLQFGKKDAIYTTSSAFKGYNFIMSGSAINNSVLTLNGIAKVTDISEGDVLDIYIGGSSITRIDVSTAVVVGTPVKNSGNIYTINNVAYKSNVSLTLGAKYTCYLGTDGVIAYATLVESAPTAYTTIYGFYVAQNSTTSWGKTTTEYKIAGVDGENHIYSVASATDLDTSTLYQWTIKDNKIASVSAVSTYSAVTYSGIGVYADNIVARLANDAVIIAVDTDGAYTLTSVDKLEKNVNLAPASGSALVLNDNYRIAILVVDKAKTHGNETIKYAVVNETSYLLKDKKTVVAFDGYLDGKVVKDYAVDVDNWFTGAGLYKLVENADDTLSMTKLTSDKAMTVNEVLVHSVLWNGVEFVELADKAIVYHSTNGAFTLSEADGIVSGSAVQLFKTDADEFYDIVIW